MAKTNTANRLTVAVRSETGKGASRRVRRNGNIPAVLYGHGADPQHLELPGHDFAAVLRHAGANAVLTLDIDGKEQLARQHSRRAGVAAFRSPHRRPLRHRTGRPQR